MKNLTNSRFLSSIAKLSLVLLTASCSLETPSKPSHDNPWDPANPEAPRSPENISGRALTETSAYLKWADLSGNELGFIIEQSDFNENTTLLVWSSVDTVGVNVDSTILINRTAGSKYCYRVVAYNPAGKSDPSALYDISMVDVKPTVPDDLALTPLNGTELRITWADRSANESNFQLQISTDSLRSFTQVILASNTTQYLLTNLAPFSTIFCKVCAINAHGNSGFTEVASGIPGVVPLRPPQIVSASALNETDIGVQWSDDNLTTESYCLLQSTPDSLHFQSIDTIAFGHNSVIVPNCNPESSYYYRLVAQNRFGSSEASPLVHASTTEATPYPPSNFHIICVREVDLVLSWQDHSSIERGFEISVSIGDTLNWTSIDTLPANSTSLMIPDAIVGADYYFKIRAFQNSRSSSGWTLGNVIKPGQVAPYAPSDFTAEAVSPTSVRVRWHDNSQVEEYHRIEKNTNGNWNTIAQLGANSVEGLIVGLTPRTEYNLRVVAVNRIGRSAPSNAVQIATPGIPVMPTNVIAEGISSTAIRISWSMTASDQQGFIIEESFDGRNWDGENDTIPEANRREFVKTGCDRYKRYYFRISAYNQFGKSAVTTKVNANAKITAAFIAVSNGGVDVFDITDPTQPLNLGNVPLDGLAQRVTVASDIAYVPANYGGIHILDIASADQVSYVTSYPSEGRAYQVVVNGNRDAFCAIGDSGVILIHYDIENRRFRLLSELSTWPGSTRGLSFLNDNLFISAMSRGVLKAHISVQNQLGISVEAGTGSTAMSLCTLPSGDIISAEYAAIRVLGSAALSEKSSINASNATEIVCQSASTAYVGLFGQGIGILDVTNPNNPQLTGTVLQMPDDVWGLTISGNYLFAAIDNAGVKIFDIQNPRSPTEVGSMNTSGPARGVGIKQYK